MRFALQPSSATLARRVREPCVRALGARVNENWDDISGAPTRHRADATSPCASPRFSPGRRAVLLERFPETSVYGARPSVSQDRVEELRAPGYIE